MNIDIEKIGELLSEHKYRAIIKKTDKGCSVNIPSAKLLKRPPIKAEIEKDKENSRFLVKANGEITDIVPVEPEYMEVAMEVIVMQLLEATANYPHGLAQYQNEAGQVISSVDFFKLFI